ncbi:MAG: sulfotransferase family protein [Acidimicrobiales bacterium]
MSGEPARLDWVCIGAQKAGTSTLFRLLREHPQILIPPGKEDPIFDREVTASEVDAYLEERFADIASTIQCGTVTPHYMSSPDTAGRVSRFAPSARIVVLLRDPVERAFSHYRMSVRRGLETRSFGAAVDEQLRAFEGNETIDADSETATYVERGRYGHLLSAWFDHFAPEQIHVEFTAELDAHPGDVLRRVHRFLGVEPQLTGDEGMRAHADPPAHRLRAARRPIANALRRIGVLDRIPVERKEQLADALERTLARVLPTRAERMPPDTAAELRSRLGPDRAVLSGLLAGDVPWS